MALKNKIIAPQDFFYHFSIGFQRAIRYNSGVW